MRVQPCTIDCFAFRTDYWRNSEQEEELRRVMLNLYVKPGSPIAASPDARTYRYRREGTDGLDGRRLHHHNPYLYLCGLIQ